MSSVRDLNNESEVVGRDQALEVNVMAAHGLQRVLKSNLGPRGTLKMLVGGAGQIKLTKDGNILLHEMQVMHPTAALVARAATAQDDITGDGTTSNVLFTAELLKQAQRYLNEGLHARVLVDGFDLAQGHALEFLDSFKVDRNVTERELLVSVARTSLNTKLQSHLAAQLTEIVTDAILCIQQPEQPIDLHMVEILHMVHRHGSDTRLVRGLILDHGSRHPDMATEITDAFVMTANISLEYEKTEIQSGFFYSSAEEREKMVEAERRFTDEKVNKIIELKRQACPAGSNKTFFLCNVGGIDILSLDMLAKAGIVALRRAKRRNMERLTLACGGFQVNSVDDLTVDCLGHAGRIYQTTLGEDKFTFVEDVQHPRSCSIMINGPNEHTIAQLKDAVRDGLRAVKNVLEDGSVIPGAGAFEIAVHHSLMEFKRTQVTGRAKLGVQAFADALLVIPKTLAENSGLDVQDAIITLEEEHARTGAAVGLDLDTGGPMLPDQVGVWDNYRVKRQFIHLSTTLACQLLLVDEVIRAGRKMGKQGPDGGAM